MTPSVEELGAITRLSQQGNNRSLQEELRSPHHKAVILASSGVES